MNENNNRVKTALPDALLNSLLDYINKMNGLLNEYLVGLTPDERMGLPKINVDNRDFVSDAINQMRTKDAQSLLPAFLKPEDAETDLKMFIQMEKLVAELNALQGKIDATRILAGSEAYTTALSFKRIAEAGEAAGVPGADKVANTLRARFKANGSSKAMANSTDTTDTGNPA